MSIITLTDYQDAIKSFSHELNSWHYVHSINTYRLKENLGITYQLNHVEDLDTKVLDTNDPARVYKRLITSNISRPVQVVRVYDLHLKLNDQLIHDFKAFEYVLEDPDDTEITESLYLIEPDNKYTLEIGEFKIALLKGLNKNRDYVRVVTGK